MTPERSLEIGRGFLDEATENITFEEFAWAFEEAWHGVAWSLNALAESPLDDIRVGEKGALPRPGSLRELLGRLRNPPADTRVAEDLERTRASLRTWDDLHDGIADLVFRSWELHDYCGRHLRLADDRLGDKLLLADAAPGRVNSAVIERRTALKLLFAGGMLPLAACTKPETKASASSPKTEGAPSSPAKLATVKRVTPIRQMQWETSDPFLFCAYHVDAYPTGNGQMGPAASLAGRHIGRDFASKDGWNMYHGREIPGFPRHPHRGFETVTVVRSGMLDHADSMGATARYGGGDVQWLTAGGGIQHAEMFPLLQTDAPNPLELFQIWLNLPKADKMVDPHFTMLWNEQIPRVAETDSNGKISELTLAAGSFRGETPPSPPPNSWGSRAEADLAIWTIRMEPGAELVLPSVNEGTHRSLYLHRGAGAQVNGTAVDDQHRVIFEENGEIRITAGVAETEILLLQGRPIAEPVAKRGPFVMNTQDEIRQAYSDFQRTQFGGWPWNDNGPVHDAKKGRFAKHINGKFEEPT